MSPGRPFLVKSSHTGSRREGFEVVAKFAPPPGVSFSGFKQRTVSQAACCSSCKVSRTSPTNEYTAKVYYKRQLIQSKAPRSKATTIDPRPVRVPSPIMKTLVNFIRRSYQLLVAGWQFTTVTLPTVSASLFLLAALYDRPRSPRSHRESRRLFCDPWYPVPKSKCISIQYR